MKWSCSLVIAGLLLSTYSARSEEKISRPPQFVLMAFDNCTELDRWQEWAAFLQDMNRDRKRVHFTYFVSGINFLAEENRNYYKGPLDSHPRGYSPIGFGGTPDEVRRRVRLINASKASGNEIGSHAVGHFYGESWSAANWLTEFESYNRLFKNVASNNDLPDRVKFAFDSSAIVGFRAPQLSFEQPLYQILRRLRFRYDTSENGEPDAWPVKEDGIWRFKLANIAVAGTDKKTLSMDYNFFVTQSNGVNDPANYEFYRDQMFQSYVDYFKSNYEGNRAPVHIGHHFANYQGGVYRAALKAFARKVCGLPEVRCTTYSALADFLDQTPVPTLEAYGNKQFQVATLPDTYSSGPNASAVTSLVVAVQEETQLRAAVLGGSADKSADATFRWAIKGKKISDGPVLGLDRMRGRNASSLTVILMNKKGRELARQDERIEIDNKKITLLPPREKER